MPNKGIKKSICENLFLKVLLISEHRVQGVVKKFLQIATNAVPNLVPLFTFNQIWTCTVFGSWTIMNTKILDWIYPSISSRMFFTQNSILDLVTPNWTNALPLFHSTSKLYRCNNPVQKHKLEITRNVHKIKAKAFYNLLQKDDHSTATRIRCSLAFRINQLTIQKSCISTIWP